MALRILDQLPRSVIMKLSELNVSKAGLITLYTIDGVQGRLGSAKDLEYKGIVFQQYYTTAEHSD